MRHRPRIVTSMLGRYSGRFVPNRPDGHRLR
jgi:hypothetical protein